MASTGAGAGCIQNALSRNASSAKPETIALSRMLARRPRHPDPDELYVDEHQKPGDAVDAGQRSEVRDQKAVDLGVAELIPGNAGDASGGKVEGDPEKGRKQ